MERNLDEESLVAHIKAPGQNAQGHSGISAETVIGQKKKASGDDKHSGSGDGCEVCSSTSAELVVSAKVRGDPRGETDMETECGALGGGGDNSLQEDSNCSTSSGNPDMTSTPDAASSLKPGARSKLRKDDSGICVRESLTSDDSKCEDEEAAARTRSGRPSLPSVSTESEGLVADILDSEDSDNNGIQDQESDSNAPSGTQGHCSDTSDAANGATAGEGPANRTSDIDVLNQSDSSDVDVINLNSSRRRRRRHTRSSSSSDSSSSASSSTTSGPDERNSDDDDDEEDNPQDMEVDMTSMPRDPWRVVPEMRSRENGYCNRMPSDRTFRQRVGSSLKFVQRLEMQNKLEHHEGCVNALNFNKSGTLLASGSDDLNVVIWNWAEKVPYLVFDSGHRSNVFQCKFMPYSGDTHIVTCARDGYVRLAELSSTGVCKGTKKLALHRSAAHKLALLQDSSHVFYSCGEDALVYEIDLRQDKPNKLSVTKENDKKVALYSISSNPFKSHEYCVGGRDHFIRIYDKRMISEHSENGIVKKFCPHHLVDHNDIKANVTCAVYNYNGTEVLGTYNDEDIYMFDNSHSDGAEYIHRYTGHRNNSTVKGVNFYGPKSEYIISGSDCSNVFLWEKESEKIVQYFHADEGGVVNVLEPHPHAPILATSGLDSDVKIWAPTAKEPTVLKGLKKVTRQNERERSNERSNEPEMIDSQMLWFLMQHLRRSARRRAQQEEEDQPSSSSDSDGGSDDSDNPPEPVQCVPQ